MRALTAIACLLAVVSLPAEAQVDPASVPGPAAAAAPSCELHIFPTNEIIDSSPDYFDIPGTQPGVGAPIAGLLGALVGGALTAAQSSGSGKLRATALEQMQAYLAPEVQVDELRMAGVVGTLKLPADTAIVAEPVLPAPFGPTPTDPAQKQAYKDYWEAMKKGRAIRPSASPCYRELIISSISISKGLGSLKFSSAFVYRTFDSDHAEMHLFDGEHSVPKPEGFPALSADTVNDANMAMRHAFSQNFAEWVAHRVKF